MNTVFSSSLTRRNWSWTEWKALHASHRGVLQYEEDDLAYQVWFYDGPEIHLCWIWKGEVPGDLVDAGYSQDQNDVDKAEFMAGYEPTANRALTPKLADGKQVFSLWPTEGAKLTGITPNWCDPVTWYPQSIRVADEVAGDSGDQTTYTLVNVNVIDTYHGKISDEDSLKDADGNSYRVVVKVNGTVKTERDPHVGSGGDYTIDYSLGKVTFASALAPSDEVKVTYHYEHGSEWILRPGAGRVMKIRKAEVQFSEDVVLNDTVRFQARGYVIAFAPQLAQSNGGPYPDLMRIPLGAPVVYKTMLDYVNEANGAYPLIPAVGGSGWRGMPQNIITFPWDYLTLTELRYSAGLEISIKLEHDVPMGGTVATATFYSFSEVE